MDDIGNFSLRAHNIMKNEERDNQDEVDSYGSLFHIVDSTDS